MAINLNDFIRQIQKNNPVVEKSAPAQQIILPNQPTVDTGDDRNPPKKMKYQPPTRNDYNEKEILAQIPQGEMEVIKKTEAKLKKSKAKVFKDKRNPVGKIAVQCSVCSTTEEIYNSIAISDNNPHVCAKCLRNANIK